MASFQSFGPASGNKEYSAAGPSTSLPQVFPAPLEILEEIFLHLPPYQVVDDCRLVCHQWRDVADSESLWKERCRRERYRPRDPSKMTKDWRLFYFLCKKRRNLLKNPKAEDGMTDWEILKNGGDGWHVEGVMVPHPNETVQKSFVTSFWMCRKSQLIDLKKEGYNPSFMDRFQPEIRISDWCAQRWDCGSKYNICVELLDDKKKPIQTFGPEKFTLDSETISWKHITHVFKDYGPGVRYIRFIHGGKDLRFWKGWYGARVTDSCVEINPSMDS